VTIVDTRRMIAAEILKIRRNRGVMAFALVLTSGVLILVFGWTAIQHASNPATNAPAGGVHGFRRAVLSLGVFFGMLSAILVGAEAGTADRASGVLRDLIVTGRSRLALFAVRWPAAAIVSLTLSAAAYAISLVATFALAGGTPTPDLGLVLQGAGWIVLANLVVTALAVGIGGLSGSRAVTLTAVIGWQVVLTNLVINVSSLGAARDALITPALAQLIPVRYGGPSVPMSDTEAIIVLAGWLVLTQALGAWRTRTLDA
jgi:ABC-type transport system involved in multi-copper enzyme maturation permease subunit